MHLLIATGGADWLGDLNLNPSFLPAKPRIRKASYSQGPKVQVPKLIQAINMKYCLAFRATYASSFFRNVALSRPKEGTGGEGRRRAWGLPAGLRPGAGTRRWTVHLCFLEGTLWLRETDRKLDILGPDTCPGGHLGAVSAELPQAPPAFRVTPTTDGHHGASSLEAAPFWWF